MTISLFVWGDSMNLILSHLIMWIIINIYICNYHSEFHDQYKSTVRSFNYFVEQTIRGQLGRLVRVHGTSIHRLSDEWRLLPAESTGLLQSFQYLADISWWSGDTRRSVTTKSNPMISFCTIDSKLMIGKWGSFEIFQRQRLIKSVVEDPLITLMKRCHRVISVDMIFKRIKDAGKFKKYRK